MELKDILTTLVALLGLFFPYIFNWFRNRSAINRATQLIEIIKRRNELKGLYEEANADAEFPEPMKKIIKNRIHELEKRGNKEVKQEPFKTFLIIIAIQVILIYSLIISGESDFFNRLFRDKSYQNGLQYTEGLFGSTLSRGILFGFVLAIALLITNWIEDKLEDRIKNKINHTILMVLIYNVVIIPVAIIFHVVLDVVDNRIDWF